MRLARCGRAPALAARRWLASAGPRGKQRSAAVGVSVTEAVRTVKEAAKARFDESVDIALKLGIDPRQTHQTVRGILSLPHGTGKPVRVAVFTASETDAEKAKAAGADVVGADSLVEQVQKGFLEFERVLATPDMMPKLGRIARILGPRGLMPNPKMGTVTKNVAEAVKAAKGGQVQYRSDRSGIIHAGIGRVSFSDETILNNLRAFMIAISNAKPDGLKGAFLKAAHFSSTMGKGVEVDIQTLDPTSTRFMM